VDEVKEVDEVEVGVSLEVAEGTESSLLDPHENVASQDDGYSRMATTYFTDAHYVLRVRRRFMTPFCSSIIQRSTI
jgi:hypothetical protein